MFFQRKPSWHKALKACDHDIAGAAIMHHLAQTPPCPALAAALEEYFQEPGYRTALAVVTVQPELVILFRESRPGGIYHQFNARTGANAQLS
ncbi:MAG TPA: hypothetical protein VFE58_07760 [Tepidisphaeraceae bacterium]|jgi:hypothetical protein|nr:hypothetical protein [Tepidisphaeraceae bacterium]